MQAAGSEAERRQAGLTAARVRVALRPECHECHKVNFWTHMTMCNPNLMPFNLVPWTHAAHGSSAEVVAWYGAGVTIRAGSYGPTGRLGPRRRNLMHILHH